MAAQRAIPTCYNLHGDTACCKLMWLHVKCGLMEVQECQGVLTHAFTGPVSPVTRYAII